MEWGPTLGTEGKELRYKLCLARLKPEIMLSRQNEPATKRQILYAAAYMGFPEKTKVCRHPGVKVTKAEKWRLGCQTDISGKREPRTRKLTSSDWPCGSLFDVFSSLIIYVGGPSPL